MKSVLATLALLVVFAASAFAEAKGEYIILTGGVSLYKWEKYKAQPHDLWWLNFVRAARLRIQEIRQEAGPDAKITMLFYEPGYRSRAAQEGRDLMPDIYSMREAYNVNIVPFSSTSAVISYLNNRSGLKIANFEYFGHSNKACWLFDYSNVIDSASKCWLHENDMAKIHRGIFAPGAYVKSWGCHTGESMSKKFASATGVKMWGAVGKTQYMTETLPILSTAGGRWVQ